MDEFERQRVEVQDERARRKWAERELAKESDRVGIWRERAESRKERILMLEGRLVEQAAARRRPASWLRYLVKSVVSSEPESRRSLSEGGITPNVASAGTPDSTLDVDEPPPHDLAGHPAAFPTVRIAVVGREGPRILDEFDVVYLDDSPHALDDADAVLVAASAFDESSNMIQNQVTEWMELVARPPLVVWIDDTNLSESPGALLGPSAELVMGPTEVFGTSFNPSMDNPIGWSPSEPIQRESSGNLDLWIGASGPVVAAKGTESPLSPSTIAMMASGVPVVDSACAAKLAAGLGLSTDASVVDVAEALGRQSELLTEVSVGMRRRTHREFSSARRAQELVRRIKLPTSEPTPSVGALLLSNKPNYLIPAIESVLAQEEVSVHLVVGMHGDTASFDHVRNEVNDLLRDVPSHILEFGEQTTLGEALNCAAETCSTPLLAKIDDDDWYGPHFLEDAVIALRYSSADLVGKAAYFVEIEETGDVYLMDGPEERYTDHVIGSSMVFRREIWERVRFPHRPSRVDSIFLRGIRAVGGRIYSNNRFEHGVRRRESGHTWSVDPARFAARGQRVGDSLESVGIDITGQYFPAVT